MISLVPMTPTQAGPTPLQGSGQPNMAQPAAGAFQALLLEALTGAQAAPGQAVPAEAVPANQAGPTAAPVPAPVPGEVPSQPIRLNGPGAPAAPVPVPVAVKPAQEPVEVQKPLTVLLAAPETAESDEPEDPEAGTDAPPAPAPDPLPAVTAQMVTDQAVQVQAQVIQASAAQAQAPAQVRPAAPEPRPAGEPIAAIPADEPANPQLEGFVQKAVRQVTGEESAPETTDPAPDQKARPKFGDLVKLVMDAEQPARPEGTKPAPKVAEAKAEEPDVALRTQQAPGPVARETALTGPEAHDTAPRQPLEPEPVLRQVTRFVKVMVDSKQSEVRLQLHPEHLGNIAVKLVVGDGVLRANLVAQDAAVKAALEANLDQLKSRLSDQGFQVEQVHVTVGGDGGFGQPQHSRQGEQRQPQQHWRPQGWTERNQEEPGQQTAQRQAPAPWSMRGTGVRLNSLA
ncbi:MAG TPA: flagellar hook-length control protein FliK [Symbiobacteriaceae bacterium]|nr:flagellar hook-length control protein FliK [Symbiobacteriaceae bacterium]